MINKKTNLLLLLKSVYSFTHRNNMTLELFTSKGSITITAGGVA